MAPTKSSDTERKDGSCETQPMEAMEISTSDDSSLLGKRKVETTNLEEDPGENEGDKEEGVEDEDEEEEEEEEEEDFGFEWDKDSFDGLEYRSSQNSEDYSDKEFEKQARFKSRAVIETKGFFEATDEFPPYCWTGIATVPGLDTKMHKGNTVREFLADMVSLCVEKYNKRKGLNVTCEHVLRANFKAGSFIKYYITFAARESDSPDAPLLEYQAKVAWSANITCPILCRPTSPPKFVERDQVKEVADEVMEESK